MTAHNNPPKRRNPPSAYGMRLRNGEWQVQHGNKIIARYTGATAERDAEAELRRRLRQPPKVTAPTPEEIRSQNIEDLYRAWNGSADHAQDPREPVTQAQRRQAEHNDRQEDSKW